MNNIVKIWDELGHMNRSDSIITATNNRVRSKNQYKDIILQLARDNYIIAARNYINYEWSAFKVKFGKSDISTIKQNNNINPKIDIYPSFYDYNYVDPMNKTQRNIWVSFAARNIGGGYKTDGWVQEEILTAEFYEMALGINKYESLGLNLMNLDEVIVWFNLVRGSEALPGKYGGRHIRNETSDTFNVKNYIKPAGIYSIADFLSIDAPKRKDRLAPYSLPEIQHLFIKSLIGFDTCVSFGRNIINTGKWGAGAFGNNFAVVFWIQVLSAKLAGSPKINFWGYRDVSPTDENNIRSFLDIFNRSSNMTFENLYELTKELFGISFTLEEIFSPLLDLKIATAPLEPTNIWGWVSDSGKFNPYTNEIQVLLNTGQQSIQFNVGKESYIIIYDPKDGWLQINMRTGTRRRVGISK